MDTATAIAWTPESLDPVIESCPVHVHRPKLRAVRKEERAKGDHKPTHSIRMEDDLWDELGEVYGERSRSGLFEQWAAWTLRRPGAKLPERKTP
jgi:hypothetical protein